MGETLSFGSPVIAQKLKNIYSDTQVHRETIAPRKSQDLKEFFKYRDRAEKESAKIKMLFK